jgi:hypothetical protein
MAEAEEKKKKNKTLQLKPNCIFKVDGPCEVKVLLVAGKWVHLRITHDSDAEVKWGTRRKVAATGPIEEYEEKKAEEETNADEGVAE